MSGIPARRALAQLVTEIGAPAPLTALAVGVMAWHTSPSAAQAAGWTALGGLFTPALPWLHLLREVRSGRVGDRHVATREQRPRILAAALGSMLIGLGALITLGAPRPLTALIIAGAAAIGATLALTLRWKISVHMAAVGGILTVCTMFFGPRVLVLLPLAALVGWARVELGTHSPAQAAAGALTGTLAGGVAFALAIDLL